MSDKTEYVVPIEEIAKIVGRTSHDARSIEENISHDEDEIDENVLLLIEKFVEAEEQERKGTVPPIFKGDTLPKIRKVPSILRDRANFKKYYEPRLVPFGPIHHREKNSRLAEQYKCRLAARFIKESGQGFLALHKIIDDNIRELKTYFHEEALEGFNDKTLSWILFVDGCAVLQFIYSLTHGQLKDFRVKNDHIDLMQLDIFLLENQIPFDVLRKLMNSSGNLSTRYKESISDFISANVMAPRRYTRRLIFYLDQMDPIHLLDLLQKVSVFDTKKNDRKMIHLGWRDLQPSFRNIQELKAASIVLRPSKSCSLADITFSSFCFSGQLCLPPMIVNDATAPIFLNLIAYECCPDNSRTHYEVTSFVSFLNSLIDDAIHVKEMRSAKILHNLLGSNDEVATLFNGIATDLVLYTGRYRDVLIDIQNFYDSWWRRWMGEVYRVHFRSPLATLAFITSLAAFAFSGIQTWFGVSSQKDHCCKLQNSTHG